jgi:phosphotransferase system HPr (HPr) family protein
MSDHFVSHSVKIVNSLGLHARAAGKLVNLAAQFDATILVEKGPSVASADSVLDLLMLTAGPGDKVTIKAKGPQARAAFEAVVLLIEQGFEEDIA